MSKKIKKYDVLAFFLPILIIMIAYIHMGVYPFGERATMIIDSYHQYVPFFSELHDKIWHGESFLYSWHGNMGFNFWTVMAYYLASPLNILIAIFPSSLMLEAFETLIILKLALASVFAGRYMAWRQGKADFASALMACFYALGGFSIAYNWNVMWLDSFALFPLVVWGADKLIHEGKWKQYVISLGLCIFCNYYIAIMVCIFQILYFFVAWFSGENWKNGLLFVKRGLLYAVCSLLSGGLAAIYLVPTYFTMISSSQGSGPKGFELYRNFFDVFKQSFVLLEPTQLEGAPNIYSGILICMLLPFFLLGKKTCLREKVLRLGLAGFLLVSLNINYLDYVWHGFHFPNNLPGRFSFIYILMVILMAQDAWNERKAYSWRQMGLIFILEADLFALCLYFAEEDIETYSAVVTGVFMVVYLLLLMAGKKDISIKVPMPKKKVLRLTPIMVLMFAMVLELGANSIFGIEMNGSTNRTTYTSDHAEVGQIRKDYEPKNEFYRMELAQIRGRDDVIWQNLNGLSFFSSTCNDEQEKLMGALGYYNSGNKYSYKGATPLTDAMTGIRYVISKEELWAQNLELAEETETKYVYENTMPLALGYMVSEDVADWQILEGAPFRIQNDFVKTATDVRENVFESIETPEPEIVAGEITRTEDNRWYYSSDKDDGTLAFNLFFGSTQDVYIYFEASHCDDLEVHEGEDITSYTDQRGHIVHLGKCDAGKVVTLVFNMDDSYSSGNVLLQIAAFNEDVFEEAYSQLTQSQWKVTDFSSTHLGGTIDVSQRGTLLMSIPYDEGWTTLVDGNKVQTRKVGLAMTGVTMETGKHTITMKYVPRGFKIGSLITAISLFMLIFASFRSRKKNCQK